MLLLQILGSLALVYIAIPLLILGALYIVWLCIEKVVQKYQKVSHSISKSKLLGKAIISECILFITLICLDTFMPLSWHSGYERFQQLCNTQTLSSYEKYAIIFDMQGFYYRDQTDELDSITQSKVWLGQDSFEPHGITEQEFLSYLHKRYKDLSPNISIYTQFFNTEYASHLLSSHSIDFFLGVSSHTKTPKNLADLHSKLEILYNYNTPIHSFFSFFHSKGYESCYIDL